MLRLFFISFALITSSFAALSPSQQSLVVKIENYLNNITTLKAKFVQVTDNGSRNGTLLWLRPKHIRLDYNEKPVLQIACDGDFFTQKDDDGDISEYSVSGTPAELLLKPKFNFQKDSHIKQIAEVNGLIMIEVASKNDPQGPSLMLIFKQSPIELTQWKMIDAAGSETDVIFVEHQYGVPLSKKDFVLEK